MSEPSSFFAKISISQEKFNEFLQAKPTQPALNENWIAWWDSRLMYEKEDLTQKDLSAFPGLTNEEIIKSIEKDGWYKPIFSDYDADTQTWHFGALAFTENFFQMLPMLAFIKSVEKYKINSPDDFAVIYDYLAGAFIPENPLDAYMDFPDNEGTLHADVQDIGDVNAEKMNYAQAYLGKIYDAYAASQGWK